MLRIDKCNTRQYKLRGITLFKLQPQNLEAAHTDSLFRTPYQILINAMHVNLLQSLSVDCYLKVLSVVWLSCRAKINVSITSRQ